MSESITVDKAISKGHLLVTLPCMLIMVLFIGLTILYNNDEGRISWVWPLVLSAFLLPWLYWSFIITKWKVWAFKNVRNVHELKKRAIQEKLIWDDDSIFNKTEIWTKNDRRHWKSIQNKFLKKDEFLFEEDLTVPDETVIYFSKNKNLLEMAIMIAALLFGLYLIIQLDRYIFGSILFLIGSYFAFKEFKQATNTIPQIILNEKGIQTVNTRFAPWNEISNENVDIHNTGRHTEYYLSYDHKDGSENILIDNYNIEYKELKRLLRIYKSRSLKN